MNDNEKSLALVKGHFPTFAEFVYENYKFAPHIIEIAEKFRRIMTGECRRLVINIAPRMGKSLTTSIIFPAWYLINRPDDRILFAAYEARFASSFGMKAKNIIENYGHHWDITLDKSSKAKDSWDLDTKRFRGGMNTAGVGGSLTGRGANVLIIDDPIKNAEESMSKNHKEKILDWYLSTADTRLEPDGATILIQTRWAKDDLTGELLEMGDEWETLIYPALIDGKSMWESRFPTKELLDRKKRIGSYWWNALYMQNPQSKEGGMFNSDHFMRTNVIPNKIIRKVRAWDIGVVGEVSKKSDYTVGVLMVLDDENNYYITDVKRQHGSSDQIQNLILTTAMQDGLDCYVLIEQQPAAAGLIVKNMYSRLLSNYPLSWYPNSKGKEMRALPLSSQLPKGNIFLFNGKGWEKDFCDEFDAFIPDKCEFDDQVDATCMAYNFLAGLEKRSIGNMDSFLNING